MSDTSWVGFDPLDSSSEYREKAEEPDAGIHIGEFTPLRDLLKADLSRYEPKRKKGRHRRRK